MILSNSNILIALKAHNFSIEIKFFSESCTSYGLYKVQNLLKIILFTANFLDLKCLNPLTVSSIGLWCQTIFDNFIMVSKTTVLSKNLYLALKYFLKGNWIENSKRRKKDCWFYVTTCIFKVKFFSNLFFHFLLLFSQSWKFYIPWGNN